MTTVQIVGIAVAAAVVVLLVVALAVTRRRERLEPPPPGTSFLDLSPQDTLDALGRAEAPVEDVTLEPNAIRSLRDGGAAAASATQAPGSAALPAEPDDTTARVRRAEADRELHATPVTARPVASSAAEQPGSPLRLDWGPTDEPPCFTPGVGVESPWAVFDADADAPEAVPGALAQASLSWTPAAPVREARTGLDASSPPGGPDHRVPLSDIIVTTSRKVIDLDDPEIRRMLTDLVKFEIDQATRYREQGQTLDAVLQLTEAEKISRALGMTESAGAIHLMLGDLQR